MVERLTADAVVIGGGIIGLMAAHYLRTDARDVLLVERGGIGNGASFGNAGMLAFSEIHPIATPGVVLQAPKWLLDPLGPLSVPPSYAAALAPWLWRFLRASRPANVARAVAAQTQLMRLARQEMEGVIVAAGLQRFVQETGTLDLYETKAAFSAARREWEDRRSAGTVFEAVEGDAIATLQPGISPRFRHAMFTPDGKQISDPHGFAVALGEKLHETGLRILEGAAASLKPSGGQGVRVELADGRTVDARTVVVAAGAWSKVLAAGIGDPVPLETERGYNTTLPPGAFDLTRQLYFSEHGFVATPVRGGVRIGGAVELGGLARPANFKRAEAMLQKAKTFLPGIATEGGQQWMGFRPSMPDSLPVIGTSRSSSAVLFAFGHGHLGLTQSAATGALIADLAAGRKPGIPLDPFRPGRFFRNS